ncbi:MAG: hypothetical protein PF961_08065 [Planctomycetota bacterium]|nr:hypothetical protein [Planctomycetota bacterium]
MSELAHLEQQGIPYASINGVAGPGGIAVTCDDTQGMQLALTHLWDLGHRRLGYVDTDMGYPRQTTHPSVAARAAAYRAFCAKQGIEPLLDWSDGIRRLEDVVAEVGYGRGVL